MLDHDIYRILKKLPISNSVNSTELLRISYLSRCGFAGLNIRISELQNLGYVSGKMKGNEIIIQITPAGINFVEDYKYHSVLKFRDVVITFVLGVISGFLLTYFVPFLSSFM